MAFPLNQTTSTPDDTIEIAVVGAHLSGMALNGELLALGGKISMRNVDGWQTLATKPIDQPIDLAA